MNAPTDNGYISDYLIHWTGKKGDEHGARVLSIIAETLQLRLSPNHLFLLDWSHAIHAKMVCFTDVPLCHSKEHCGRYGRFGIAFQKMALMNHGAQPVFYASHTCKRDMNTIFRFLQEQMQSPTLSSEVFKALQRHFYFIKSFSDGPANSRDAFYYEREWRLGEQTLATKEDEFRTEREGYPLPYAGELVKNGDEAYFRFEKEWVAFLVVPQFFQSKINNPHEFQIEPYENLVTMCEEEK
jgi:hypothetical protein